MEPAARCGCHPYTISGEFKALKKKSVKTFKLSRSVKPGSHYRQQIVPSNFRSKPAYVMFALTKVGRYVVSQATKWLTYPWDLLPYAGNRTHCKDSVVLLIQFSSSLHEFMIFKPKKDLYDKAWRSEEKILVSWIIAASGPGTTAKVHHRFQSLSLNFTLLHVIFSRGLQSPLLVPSEEGKGKFWDKLGDLWRQSQASVAWSCSRENWSALSKFIFSLTQ